MKKRDSYLRFKNKKAQWLQLTFGIVIILALAIIMIVMSKFQGSINDMIQSSDMSNESKIVSSEQTSATISVFDGAIMIVLLGVWLLCLGLAYNSGSSPFLLVIAIVIILSLGFVGMILSNMWDSFMSDDSFSNVRDSFPMTDFLLNNFLISVLVIGFSTLLVAFTQRGGF